MHTCEAPREGPRGGCGAPRPCRPQEARLQGVMQSVRWTWGGDTAGVLSKAKGPGRSAGRSAACGPGRAGRGWRVLEQIREAPGSKVSPKCWAQTQGTCPPPGVASPGCSPALSPPRPGCACGGAGRWDRALSLRAPQDLPASHLCGWRPPREPPRSPQHSAFLLGPPWAVSVERRFCT